MASLLPLLALMSLAPGGDDDPSFTARSTIVTTLSPFDAIYSAPAGAGYDGVAGLLIEKVGGTFLCTGSLVGGAQQHVVTAAHCLAGATNVDAVFFPPVGDPIVRSTSAFEIHASYTGEVIDENDIGVVDLGTSVSEVGSYSLFTGDAVGEVYNVVGFGRSGTGETGSVLSAGVRRQGFNRFDFRGTDPIFGSFWGDQNVLFADFDNGLLAQDASCRLTFFFTPTFTDYCDAGLGPYEVMTAPGDSGGPLFVDGRLAAVSSFGLTFSDGIVGDIDGDLNSSFGEFGGYVPISAHADWIRRRISVPEPSTILLVFSGLLAIGIARRRRPSEAA